MIERSRRFHTFESPEELLEYYESLPEGQKDVVEKAWDAYCDLREEGIKVEIKAEKRLREVFTPLLALNTFALIEIFKGNSGVGLGFHAAGDLLGVKAFIDYTRETTRPKLKAIQKGMEALRQSGIEIKGIRDLLKAVQLSRSFDSTQR